MSIYIKTDDANALKQGLYDALTQSGQFTAAGDSLVFSGNGPYQGLAQLVVTSGFVTPLPDGRIYNLLVVVYLDPRLTQPQTSAATLAFVKSFYDLVAAELTLLFTKHSGNIIKRDYDFKVF